jgi:hypothetical protein
MKRLHIVPVAFLTVFVFCTKENPVEVTTASDYSDSIVMDLFSYNVYTFTHWKQYYGTVEITPKGHALLKPLDSSILRSYDSSTLSAVIMPKYQPNRYEAWMYDSIPLIRTDPEDTNVLVKSYAFSMQYFFRLDTPSVNYDKCIKPIDLTYMYGYGFVIRDPIWGTGKLKIFYK